MAKKIATCSYCGVRAVLVFDEGLHELSCGACGAPLHDMKVMPQPAVKKAKKKTAKPGATSPRRRCDTRKEAGRARRPEPRYDPRQDRRERSYKRRYPKKRKPLLGRVLEEIWDVVEDIFD